MNTLNAFQRWLHERCWLNQLLRITIGTIILVYIFGLTGLFEFALYNFRDPSVTRSLPVTEMRQKEHELETMLQTRLAHAKEIGSNYRPRNYFEDLTAAHEYLAYYQLPTPSTLTQLEGQMFSQHPNVQELNSAQREYGNKLYHRFPWYELSVPEAREKREAENIPLECLAWLFQALAWYCKVALCLIPLYLLRMVKGWQTCQTGYRENRRAFWLAILLWPRELWAYPGQRLRALVVNTVLRQHGDALRTLNSEERQVVHELIQRRDFRKGLKELRKRLPKPRRSFACALLAALTCTCLAAIQRPATREVIPTARSSISRQQPALRRTEQLIRLVKQSPANQCVWTVPERDPPSIERPVKTQQLINTTKMARQCRGHARLIDHIPLSTNAFVRL